MSTTTVLLSPAELAYLYTSLSLSPPIRPDGRLPTQFRPLIAETSILPSTNGSARVCFADGTEALVGIKLEINKTKTLDEISGEDSREEKVDVVAKDEERGTEESGGKKVKASHEWVEISIEIPGVRDDDSGTIFLASMVSEALVANSKFAERLRINSRFHWRLYIDILLISSPLSYPLPLLSLTTHLALLNTRIPKLISEADEDPMFHDDWAVAPFLFDRTSGFGPPITLLVISVGPNILFDPSAQELAVAETALAVSVVEYKHDEKDNSTNDKKERDIQLVAVRTVDPPSRLTAPGVPNIENTAVPGVSGKKIIAREDMGKPEPGVWRAPVGGARLGLLERMIDRVLEKGEGGIVGEVLDGIEGMKV